MGWQNSPVDYFPDERNAGKRRLSGNTERRANASEVEVLRREANDPKQIVAELTLETACSKKA